MTAIALKHKLKAMENILDYALVEGDLNQIADYVENVIEAKYEIEVSVEPSICLTMVKAEDSVESQPFYLGELLTTDCEVVINGKTGIGIVSGDQPVRAYCIAVIDAIKKVNDEFWPEVEAFVNTVYNQVKDQEKKDYNQVLRTRVDFKLMEQA